VLSSPLSPPTECIETSWKPTRDSPSRLRMQSARRDYPATPRKERSTFLFSITDVRQLGIVLGET